MCTSLLTSNLYFNMTGPENEQEETNSVFQLAWLLGISCSGLCALMGGKKGDQVCIFHNLWARFLCNKKFIFFTILTVINTIITKYVIFVET